MLRLRSGQASTFPPSDPKHHGEVVQAETSCVQGQAGDRDTQEPAPHVKQTSLQFQVLHKVINVLRRSPEYTRSLPCVDALLYVDTLSLLCVSLLCADIARK